jgi:hypothetical protein
MRKLVEVTEVAGEGLDSLLGQNVLIFCLNYIYTGKLTGVNDSCILLEQPSIVYETGPWSDAKYKDVQRLHCDKWYVQRSAIESFGVGK